MAQKEMKLIRRGVPRREYIAYFQSLGQEQESSRFTGPGWEVVLGEERQVELLRCLVQEVEIVFRAEEELIEQMVQAFRKQFMRAGA